MLEMIDASIGCMYHSVGSDCFVTVARGLGRDFTVVLGLVDGLADGLATYVWTAGRTCSILVAAEYEYTCTSKRCEVNSPSYSILRTYPKLRS